MQYTNLDLDSESDISNSDNCTQSDLYQDSESEKDTSRNVTPQLQCL